MNKLTNIYRKFCESASVQFWMICESLAIAAIFINSLAQSWLALGVSGMAAGMIAAVVANELR